MMNTTSPALGAQERASFDCLVLSGGGAKGAYGAGAAKALDACYRLQARRPSLCLIGTSAGAFSACVFAAYGADRLVDLWLRASNRRVLGVRIRSPQVHGILGLVKRLRPKPSPFSVYRNTALRRFIEESVKFDDLQGKHLIVTATDYARGSPTAFYLSSLVDDFVNRDRREPVGRQRLSHCVRIGDQESLVRALLASSAIPLFFPPIRLQETWFIDGGVGNNTPSREAAYFLRYLEESGLGRAGDVYCVKQDRAGITMPGRPGFGALTLFERTLEVFQYIHMEPIIRGWFRINDEVARQSSRVAAFNAWLDSQGVALEVREEIVSRVQSIARLGGATLRRSFPMIEIEPSSALGSAMDFDPRCIRENVHNGYRDMLISLWHKGKIDHAEYQNLVNERPYSE